MVLSSSFLRSLINVLLVVGTASVWAEQPKLKQTLFTNVDIFNGVDDKLEVNHQVLVEGNLIKAVGVSLDVADGVTVVDGQGGTLMPGLIDMHSHLTHPWNSNPNDWDAYSIGAVSAHNALFFLEQGYTTTRSTGGPDLGLAKIVRLGYIPGPRIYPAGPYISQTGGHGHNGYWPDPLGFKDEMQLRAGTYVVDGVAEVLAATRHNLRRGATHIKLMAGGGASSEFDPLHTNQYTLEELKAAVQAAADWGTYVTVHAYTDESVNRAIDAGVKCIEHGALISEKTIKRMAKEGVVLSYQAALGYTASLPPEHMPSYMTPAQKRKYGKIGSGYQEFSRLLRKHNVMVVSGADTFGNKSYVQRTILNVVAETAFGFTPFEALLHHTGNAGKVLKEMGLMHKDLDPYPDGRLGVIAPGAYADLLIVKGNPLQSLDMFRDYKNTIQVVMKDGKFFKNQL